MSSNVPLGHRERQIVDTVVKLGEATVSEVLAAIPNPPTYSTVRKMLSGPEEKGVLKLRAEKNKYIYSTLRPADSFRRAAMKNVLQTLFGGSVPAAVNTLLDLSGEKLTKEEFSKLRELIKKAENEGI